MILNRRLYIEFVDVNLNNNIPDPINISYEFVRLLQLFHITKLSIVNNY